MQKTLIIICLLCLFNKIKAQIDFSFPDTVCVNDSVTIKNLSRNAGSYYWHLCSANLKYYPESNNIGNIGNLDGPAFITIVKDNNNDYYGFVTNHTNGTLTRLFFGNSLLNTPVGTNMGDFAGALPQHIEGIQVLFDNGKWIGYIVGGLTGESAIIKLDFGNDLSNTPTAFNLGNIGNLKYPIDLYIFKEGGTWIGYTVNFDSNSVTQFYFGGSLSNIPIGTNLGNIGNLSQPCGIFPINSEGNWYFFVSNFNTHSLTRLDFGNSLSNKPIGKNISSLMGMNYPFDMSIIRDCGKYYGYLLNRYDEAIRLDFPLGISQDPVVTSIGTIGGLTSPHGVSEIYRQGDTIILFIANSSTSTLTRLTYPSCNASTLLTSTLREPPAYSYRFEGEFNVQLILDKGFPTEEALCKSIIVLPKPPFTLGPDTFMCEGKPLALNAPGGYKLYKWINGSSAQSFTVDSSSLVWLEVTDQHGCKARDTINITEYPKTLNLGNDTIIDRGEPFTIDAGSGYLSYKWSNGENSQSITTNKEGKYLVEVTDQYTCNQSDDIQIRYRTLVPNFFTPNGDGQNDIWEIPFLSNYPKAEVKIYDRYGKMVALLKNGEKSWNGRYNGTELPIDSYWYFIDLKDGSDVIKGYVTIKR